MQWIHVGFMYIQYLFHGLQHILGMISPKCPEIKPYILCPIAVICSMIIIIYQNNLLSFSVSLALQQ
jgi:hypothetical protein